MSFVCLNHVAIYNNWTSALMLETSLLLGSKLRILLYWVCVSAFFCCAHARMIGRIFLCAFKRWYQATISGVGICLPWGHLDNQTSLAGAELVSAFKVPTAEGHGMALSFLLALPVAELRKAELETAAAWGWVCAGSPARVPIPPLQHQQNQQTLDFHRLSMLVLLFPIVKALAFPYLKWQNSILQTHLKSFLCTVQFHTSLSKSLFYPSLTKSIHCWWPH